MSARRPAGITALAFGAAVGAAIALVSAISLLFPGGFLEPMWRLNPRGREGFARIGGWAPLLLLLVAAGCAAASIGLGRGRRWGYRLAVFGLVVHLVGDAVNVLTGYEPRAIFGIPIVAGILYYLSTRRVREYFAAAPTWGIIAG